MKTTITLLSIACTLLVTGVSTAWAQPCDTLYSQFMQGTPTLNGVQGGGYIVGNNIYDDKAKAQHYPITSPKEISEVAIWFGAKDFTSGNSASSITLNIYDMDGTGTSTTGTVAAPGTILSSATVFIQDIDTSNADFMYITLPNPITVTGDYAAGVDLTPISAGDTIGILCTADGDGGGAELSWEKWSDNTWHSFLSAWPLDVDLAIFPIECHADVDTTCSVSFVLYPDTTLAHNWFAELSSTGSPVVDYFWDWGDGTSSSEPYPSHIYDSAGYYTICVYTTNTNNCIASYCDSSTYIYKTDAEMISVTVIASQTGIEETAKNTFSLYPNPATTTLTLQTEHRLPNTDYHLQIHNAQGQLVTSSVVEKQTSTFDISSFSNGIYFLTLSNGEQTLSKKFIKQ